MTRRGTLVHALRGMNLDVAAAAFIAALGCWLAIPLVTAVCAGAVTRSRLPMTHRVAGGSAAHRRRW